MDKYRYHKDGTLPEDEAILVFGSNLAGRHGAGCAVVARKRFGAVYGVGIGRTGRCYALPTKSENLRLLGMKRMQEFIQEFREHTKCNKHETYFVTRVACRLAGYEDADIAPLFRGATRRCNFPIDWKEYVE